MKKFNPPLEVRPDKINKILNDLQNKIAGIDKNLDGAKNNLPKVEAPTLPKPDLSVDTTYKEYDAPTDEALGNSANADLSEYKSASETAIKNKANSKTNAINSSIAEMLEKYDATAQSTTDYYSDARQESSNSNLKRGLARSTMAQLSQDALNAQEASTRSNLKASLDKGLVALDSEIRSVETERESALADFDIAYAAKLTQKLDDLMTQRDTKKAETLEYNNALKERLTKLAMEQEKWAQQYKDSQIELDKKESVRIEKYNQEIISKRNEDVFNEVSTYLSGMSRAEARNELSNPYFRSVLSSYHYSLLSNALNAQR